MFKASRAVRVFFLNTSIFAMIGIWLSGFSNVHWFSYLVPSFFFIAAVTGICPGMIFLRKIFGETQN